MKTIIVACGSGIATSTIIAEKVRILIMDNGIPSNIIQCSVPDIESHADHADLIVTSMNLTKKYVIPTVSAFSFLTGIGAEDTEKLILEYLRS